MIATCQRQIGDIAAPALIGSAAVKSRPNEEGVNTKIKMLKRQTYGRASFTLLRRRILLVE
ncbi:hypothetical protein SAMN05216215_11283 [Saccharopolyspora shandongensis]|uniref:Transposase n=1 Tax=Saccharopolyspora shandongensis TaxID=418495 RepID=A0A1H3UCQ4_9PSEU|nr:hypothetical protein [Saccharopolyspora shandongensis]SDZ59635.1 hypothetical protein SAMN05216215_11283 [Saccharopolyspora shandongensis]